MSYDSYVPPPPPHQHQAPIDYDFPPPPEPVISPVKRSSPPPLRGAIQHHQGKILKSSKTQYLKAGPVIVDYEPYIDGESLGIAYEK